MTAEKKDTTPWRTKEMKMSVGLTRACSGSTRSVDVGRHGSTSDTDAVVARCGPSSTRDSEAEVVVDTHKRHRRLGLCGREEQYWYRPQHSALSKRLWDIGGYEPFFFAFFCHHRA